MQIEEYHALERVERDHWFYQGKRALVKWWIERAITLQTGDRIVDAGAGTGELVRELRRVWGTKGVIVTGVEFEATARAIALETKQIELMRGSILDLPVADNSVRVAIAMDVLEHVEDDSRALSELVRVTQAGGLIIVNVPAFMSLWSEWDVTLAHFRRYTKQSFRKLLSKHAGNVEVLYFDYTNIFAFVPILIYRKLAKMLKLRTRAEDKVPSSWMNSLLRALYLGPTKQKVIPAPFGSSLFCVLRKK